MHTDFSNAVLEASKCPEIHSAIHDLYQSLQTQIDLRKPICNASGRCCHFDEFGHRLYITTAEMATFLYDYSIAGSQRPPEESRHSLSAGYSLPQMKGCSYQIDGLCSVHPIRPFGCRIFFCDPTATDWQRDQYEIFHQQLKLIHSQFSIPYFYMEWRAALGELALGPR
jgi:Fe-S-cluster containining protein